MKRKTSLYTVDMRHDIDESEGGAGGSTIYSLEEKEVGKWVDGAPVYEKSFYSDKFFPTMDCTDLNIKNVIELTGTTYQTSNHKYNPISNVLVSSSNTIGLYYSEDDKNIIIESNNNQYNYGKTFVRIRYTKN